MSLRYWIQIERQPKREAKQEAHERGITVRGCRRAALPLLSAALLLGSAACENSGANASNDEPTAQAPAVESGGSTPEVVAKLSGQPITLEEVDAQVMQTNMALIQELYDVRQRAVNEIVENRLLDAEAKARGISRQVLLTAEVDAKVEEVTDKDVETFFNENKDQVGGQTLEVLRPRIRTFLARERSSDRRDEFVSSLREKAGFELFLDPPRRDLQVAANEPARGPANAPVTIVEYSDFECPFCSRVVPTLYELIDKYPDQIRLVYRDFPLTFHPNAQLAAEAAQCAHTQGKFWAYHDKLFGNQKELGRESLDKYAADLELDTGKFGQCLDDRQHQPDVLIESQQGGSYGVTGTPAFFINGRFVSGALPFERFSEVIEDELDRQKKGS